MNNYIRVVTHTGTNISLTTITGSVNGHTLVAGEYVLVEGQTDPAENGIYIVDSDGIGFSSRWGPPDPLSTDMSVYLGLEVLITDGTDAGDIYQQTEVGTLTTSSDFNFSTITALSGGYVLNPPDLSTAIATADHDNTPPASSTSPPDGTWDNTAPVAIAV